MEVGAWRARSEEYWKSRALTTMQTTSVAEVLQVVRGWMLDQVPQAWGWWDRDQKLVDHP